MIKTTLGEIEDQQDVLAQLVQIKFPIKISYWISRINNKAKQEFNAYRDKKFDLIKEFGEQTNPETDTWSVKKENFEKFQKQLDILKAIEVQIDFDKIKIDDLGAMSIEPNLLLSWIFE